MNSDGDLFELRAKLSRIQICNQKIGKIRLEFGIPCTVIQNSSINIRHRAKIEVSFSSAMIYTCYQITFEKKSITILYST